MRRTPQRCLHAILAATLCMLGGATRALLKFLSSPDAIPVMRRKGMEPA